MEYITSRNNPRIKKILSYYESENIIKDGVFINEGIINLKECLNAGVVEEIYLIDKYKDEFKKLNIPIYVLDESVFKKVSKLKNPSGVLFLSRVNKFDYNKAKRIIYLDNVQDPGNVGTIIRTALAFKFDLVVLSETSASLYNPKVLSSARGSVYKIPVIKKDISLLSNEFKNHKVISTTLDDDSISLKNFKAPSEYILIFGNEGRGINREIIDSSDYKLKIDMNDIDSLNVALSMAIISYKLSE